MPIRPRVQMNDTHLDILSSLSLSLNRFEAAVMAFRKAQSLRTDLCAYQGLVRAYLAIPKHKGALGVSREATKAMPHSAKALTLVGDIHAQNPEGRENDHVKIRFHDHVKIFIRLLN